MAAEPIAETMPSPTRAIIVSSVAPPTSLSIFDRTVTLALALVEETCVYLGMGVATVMNTLAPDVIVIGGGVCKAGRVLFEPLRKQADRFLMPVHRRHLRILPAQRKDRSVLMGAVALARHHIV